VPINYLFLCTVVNYEFINTAPEITVIEGQSVALQTGMNPVIMDARGLQLFRLRTENGSAVGK